MNADDAKTVQKAMAKTLGLARKWHKNAQIEINDKALDKSQLDDLKKSLAEASMTHANNGQALKDFDERYQQAGGIDKALNQRLARLVLESEQTTYEAVTVASEILMRAKLVEACIASNTAVKSLQKAIRDGSQPRVEAFWIEELPGGMAEMRRRLAAGDSLEEVARWLSR